ncbi:hypothetical protein AGLY_013204, partial [Aphis glycines]
ANIKERETMVLTRTHLLCDKESKTLVRERKHNIKVICNCKKWLNVYYVIEVTKRLNMLNVKSAFIPSQVNSDLRKKWIKKCDLEDDILIKSSHKICSLHFTEDSYLPMFPKSKGLKPTAVPSFFINSSSISVNDSNTSTLSLPKLSNNISYNSSISSNDSNISTLSSPFIIHQLHNLIQYTIRFCRPPTRKKLNFHPRYIGDCTEDHFSTPIRSKKNLIFVKNQYLLQTKKIKCLQQQNRNLKKKNTGFVGLILSLETAVNLFKYLHYNHSLEYLLAKTIWNCFSTMRSKFGFNNNPNCQQFETEYKRLLFHHHKYGNCAILDATIILPLDNGTNLIIDTDVTQDILSEMDINQLTDHDYIKTVWKLNRFIEVVSVYIKGFVVRKLLKRINHLVCSSCIQNSDTDNYLINIKNLGSLIKPSKDVELLFKESEKCIRQHQEIVFKQKNIVRFLKNKVKRALYEVVFKNEEMYQHIICQQQFNNHRDQLMNLIITFYLNIRLHHKGKQFDKESRLQNKFNKLLYYHCKIKKNMVEIGTNKLKVKIK